MNFETLETRNLMSATLVQQQPAPEAQTEAAIVMSVSDRAAVAYGMTAGEKHAAEQITSTFENSTTELQYDFCKNIEDGRGYTAGRAGFTTGTGDFYEVVKRYSDEVPSNPLANYLPRLKKLADKFAASGWETPAGSTSGLDGIDVAWKQACNDPKFLAAQDSLVDEWYYTPAMDRAQQLGLTYAISKGQLWNALIQHGDGSDPDSLGAMIDRTNARSGGTPASGVSETAWLKNFMDVRIETLTHATNPDTASAWAKSTDRVKVYQGLLKAGNLGLTGEMRFTCYGDDFVVYGPTAAGSPTTPTPTPAPATPGRIAGRVIYDETGNGLTSDDIWGDEARVVFIDANHNGVRDTGERSASTDADGNFAFDGLAAGAYDVRLESVSWFNTTTPIHQQVNVQSGQTATVNFAEASA